MKMTRGSRYCKFLGVVSLPLSVATVASLGNIAQAQIIPDETLGNEGSVVMPLNGQADRIDGGAARGSNLFHSFQEFNIGEGRGAYFANPAVIENIFSRVTGSNPSRLLGTLGVLGDANLFFLNPNGIIFGKNARLDIRGSLVTSTANSLLFPDGNQFSATDPQAPPLLEIDVPTPLGLQFEGEEVGAIINAGELEVGANLSVVGGTVASTGQLSAPEGEVAVSTVSGVEAEGNLAAVELGESGQILEQEMQPLAGGSSQTETSALAWSELVADGGEETGLTVNDEGKVELTQSDNIVSPGDIAINQLIAQGAKLSATENLTLVESQLGTVGDLTLLAQDTVRVRDSVANPFIAAAGGELLVQGDRGVDIFALNHPNSGLFSGGDLVLRSASPVGGDAHYWSGGNFRIEKLDESLGDLFSPYDPIIRSLGDVSFNDYVGSSLHILAGGSVDIRTAIITEPETGAVESDFIEENVQLSDGTEISINGSTQPTLDIRAGIDPKHLGELEFPSFSPSFSLTGFSDTDFLLPEINLKPSSTSANITIGDIAAPDGVVFLTNNYEPNPSLKGKSGDITVNGAESISIDGTTVNGIYAPGFDDNGGNVILDSKANITLSPNSFIDSSSGSGKGGNITLISNADVLLTNGAFVDVSGEQGGNIAINARNIEILGRSQVRGGAIGSTGLAGGQSGDIVLDATGTIAIESSQISNNVSSGSNVNGGDVDVIARSLSLSNGAQLSTETDGQGNGGSVRIKADTVSFDGVSRIVKPRSGAFSTVRSGAEGNAGGIEITTGSLSLTNGALLSTETDGQGNGGSVRIEADTVSFDNQSDALSGVAGGSSSNAGGIKIITGSLSLVNNSFLNARSLGEGNAGSIIINATDTVSFDGSFALTQVKFPDAEGKSGEIEITTRSLSLTNGAAMSTITRGGGNAGGIEITTDSLSLTNDAALITSTFAQGDAGSIIINANDTVSFDESFAYSTVGSLAEPGAKGNGGNIDIQTRTLSLANGSQILANTFGKGNAGKIQANASDSVIISGFAPLIEDSSLNPSLSSGLITNTEEGAGGKGNDINVITNRLQVSDGAVLSTLSRSNFRGGNITVKANAVEVTDGGQLITTAFSEGNAGDIILDVSDRIMFSGSDPTFVDRFKQVAEFFDDEMEASVRIGSVRPESGLFANTATIGAAGNITVTTSELTLQQDAQISTSTTVAGKAGNITLDTPFLNLASGGKILAFTSGSGDGGTITVNAPKEVNLGIGVQDFEPIISVETSGAGKAGDIFLTTSTLTLSDTARITATATATATNQEEGGSISLNASKMDLAGIVGVFAETQGKSPAGTLKLQPDNNQPTLDLTLASGAKISASTSASGNGGNLLVNARQTINIRGQGELAVETTGTGDAGNIELTTQKLTLNDGVKISASTSEGAGGTIKVNANTFDAMNGAKLLTTTSGKSSAGSISLNVSDNITLAGDNTGLFANTTSKSTGNGGSIFIDPRTMIIRDGTRIAVDSQGKGTGGNIEIFSGSLTLDNRSKILADTASTNGGNITLQIDDEPLLLRRGSEISATAGDEQFGGNGGNITISAPFIIAFPNENSDVTANAFEGNGGNIDITTNAIFGIEFRDEPTPLSDFTVSSELGIDGNFALDDSGIDPTRGLIILPEETVNTQISQGCQTVRGKEAVEYFEIGRGGLPPNPNEPLNADAAIEDWINLEPKSENDSDSGANINSPQPDKAELISPCPAQSQ